METVLQKDISSLMGWWKQGGILTLLLLSLGARNAADAQMSLSTAVDLALKSDPRVHMAQASLDKAKAALAQAHDVYIPSASISGGDGKSTGVPLSLPTIFSITSQSLLFTFSQKDYVRAAHAGVDSATLALQDVQQQVMEDVATTYTSLNNAEQKRDAMGQEYAFAMRLASITEDRASSGQDTEMDMLRAKRTVAQIRLQKLQTEDDVATLADHLARIVGLPGNSIATVTESIPALQTASIDLNTPSDNPGIRSALANAKAKEYTALGDARYRFRPQVSFGAGYSRISTFGTNYGIYYPTFSAQSIAENDLSLNALSVGIQIQVPFFDKSHDDKAHESAAEARRLAFEAQFQRNQFLEGRLKLSHTAQEASARMELAKADVAIAQADIQSVLLQLTPQAGDPNKPQLTPKDETNARLQERQHYVEMLDAQSTLMQVQINLLRQTGQLADWLRASVTGRTGLSAAQVSH